MGTQQSVQFHSRREGNQSVSYVPETVLSISILLLTSALWGGYAYEPHFVSGKAEAWKKLNVFPKTTWFMRFIQSKDLILVHCTSVPTLFAHLLNILTCFYSLCCHHDLSPKCFNCILPLRTLKQTEGNSPKSNQLVRDWVQSMLYLQSPHLVQWIPPPQAPGVGLFNLELQDVGVVQEGHKLSETYKKYLVLEWESLVGFRLSAAALYWKD